MSSLGKIRYFFTIIYRNGGLWKSLWKLGRFDTLKDGRNVGCDAFGNQYFENNYYFIGRSRWVEYNKSVKLEYDATQITPDWSQCWLLNHQPNLSGTTQAYYPYDTTRSRIAPWDGTSICSRR
ncbi:PREDICTED: probable NADH dehydrogenase [ubiquinone] 1 alpha subcomplex subunit 12 isoform X2 [Papilio polytes]|uniref:probable NADH dehydrogenase [ubiquinone] 1 alpha subcomplex subunit 12 isoform X2 n=1 Tax=Papilio polytes TaxID=76194 RepID=UPI000675BF46|nr:PREDICTED: probable NADH dehydrogenase [ubiquinone] 1 alpha subcomplex subunit 12 isoform X2 [Papilio polytes]